ncbi:beta-glucosidase family protein [Liberiplasma polymorphum]|uniref:beta-glucosidase n=1 Tax=Liberiplasma polymorphum TaxID=3374570 RepID=UPI0037764573
MNINDILNKITVLEKASLCSGKNLWETKSVNRLNIPSIMMTDGPHGLRKEKTGSTGIAMNESVQAVCFPTAVTLASSFDKDLIAEVGKKIGDHALNEGVFIVLGPGVNIKRSPLCGRNFEYFSEDPYLSGKMAASWIQGVQSTGVGASIKHFAANNQENYRMTIDSIVDERALHEIYLEAFRIAITESNPYTVMCSYNKLNGVYAAENRHLLTEILRNNWGYKGVVISDWGATNNRVLGLKAGLDLEMPSSNGENDERIIRAIKKKELSERTLNETIKRLLEFIDKKQDVINEIDLNSDHVFAKKVAAESMVLLKNDNVLPLEKKKTTVIIGALAESFRFQGAGSSRINPTHKPNLVKAQLNINKNSHYIKGYHLDGYEPNTDYLATLIEQVKKFEQVIVCIGLPESFESEGFDRSHMALPQNQIDLLIELKKAGKKIVAVLLGGSPVEMPWLSNVDALLNAYLPGQAGDEAILSLLYGDINPSGKLAETYPIALEDTPAAHTYGKLAHKEEYYESIYVGYRYYDKTNTSVLFPFGYGLSYTTFDYSNFKLSKKTITDLDTIIVSFDVTNTGLHEGKEVAQVYVGMKDSKIYREVKKLRGFEKVTLKPSQTETIKIALSFDDFAYFNRETSRFEIEEGVYKIMVGASSQAIKFEKSISVSNQYTKTPVPKVDARLDQYIAISNNHFNREAFKALFIDFKESEASTKININTPLDELKKSFIGRIIVRSVEKEMQKQFTNDPTSNLMIEAMLKTIPFRSLATMSQGKLRLSTAEGLVHFMNHRYVKGMKKFILKR